jgi:hypothetical protein
VCSKEIQSTKTPTSYDYIPLKMCGGDNFMLVPQSAVSFDMESIKTHLERDYTIKKMGTHSITLNLSTKELISIFKGGNVLIRGCETVEIAVKIWNEIRSKYRL